MVQCDQRNMLRLLTVILILRLNISLTKVPVTDYVHVGCYRKSAEKNFSDAHLATEYFWRNCISRCTEDYAGVNFRDCFCGDEIDQTFIATDNADCEICPLHSVVLIGNTRYCGGSDTMSLYKLLPTKASETAILLATDNVKMWVFENYIESMLSPRTILKLDISFVAYHHIDRAIYFVSGSKIFTIGFYDSPGEYNETPTVIMETKCNNVIDLAIDWVNYGIFWGCKDTKSIHWKNKISGIQHHFHIHSEDIKDITLEPYRKFLIYINATGLVKYDFTSSKTNILQKHNFTYLLHIAADVQEERLYMIGNRVGEDRNYLVSTDYSCTTFKVVFSGTELSYPFGLEAVNGTVVWGSKNNKKYTLYKIKVSSSQPVMVKAFLTQSEKIKDFKMYTCEAKNPSTKYLCEIKNCSHSCVRLSSTQVNCSCPETMFLTRDDRTCDKPSLKTEQFMSVLVVVVCLTTFLVTIVILVGLLIFLALRQQNLNRSLPVVQYSRSQIDIPS